MLPLVYFIGRLANINIKNIDSIIKYTIGFSYILCLFGLIDYFFARDIIYNSIFSVDNYFYKQAIVGFIPFKWSVGDVMQTGIFVDYTWGVLQRFLTTYIEPTTLGSFLSICLLYSVFYKNALTLPKFNSFNSSYLKFFLNFLLFFCIVLTFSKGALIILFTGASYILSFNKKIPLFIRKIIVPSTFLVIGLLVFYFIITNSGASAHINGLTTGITTAVTHPFGLGLGNAGNYVQIASSDTSELVGTESAVGCMLAQLGIFGYLPYLLYLIILIKNLSNGYLLLNNINTNVAKLSLTTAGAFYGYAINSLFTESASGVTGNFYYFLFTGLLISKIPILQGRRIKFKL